MGDLRNKLRKEEEQARIASMQRRLEASRPRPVMPRCQCGNTWNDVPIMWSHQAGYWDPGRLYCPACLPHNLLRDSILT
jgi:hypothetical protein